MVAFKFGDNLDFASSIGKFNSIRKEIKEHLLKPLVIGLYHEIAFEILVAEFY